MRFNLMAWHNNLPKFPSQKFYEMSENISAFTDFTY